MARRYPLWIILLPILAVGSLAIYWLGKGPDTPQWQLARAARREIRVVVSTNGIIEPAKRNDIYAPIDALVVQVPVEEGTDIVRGQLLMRLEAGPIRTALADARAALLGQKRQARTVLKGPSGEEMAELEASIAECGLQLNQVDKELKEEESLYAKGAVPRASVDNLRKQRDLLELRAGALKKKQRELEQRYSREEQEWEQGKVDELARQVELLEQQLRMESVIAPVNGRIYALAVKPGTSANRGQLLAQIYQPGGIRLRAYVDEPDLGQIQRGQQVRIEWDGLPDRRWTGHVDRPAQQVVPLNTRSVGHVLCTVDGEPEELIPNLNVKVEIVTASKRNALVVPRAAVFNREGRPAVLLSEAQGIAVRHVVLGLATPEEIEILEGITEGSSVVLNHGEADRF